MRKSPASVPVKTPVAVPVAVSEKPKAAQKPAQEVKSAAGPERPRTPLASVGRASGVDS